MKRSTLLLVCLSAVSFVMTRPELHAQGSTTAWRPITSATGYAGAVNAISIDPRNAQIIVVGTQTGGLFRTIDGGANWASVSAASGPWTIRSIARQPTALDTLYAGVGTRDNFNVPAAVGLLRSTDNGATWLTVTATSLTSTCDSGAQSVFAITSLAFSPDGLTLLAGTPVGGTANTGGIHRTGDGGVSWERTFCATQGVADVTFTASGRALAVNNSSDAQNNRGIASSVDGGVTWTTVNVSTTSTEFFRRVVSAPSDPNVAYTLGDKFFRSANGGASFVQTSTTAFETAPISQYALWVDPTNPNVIVTASGLSFYRSTDAGANWTKISDPIASPLAPGTTARVAMSDPGFNGTTNTRLFVGTSVGFFRTDDIYAQTPVWTPLNNGLSASSIASLAVQPDNTLVGLTDGTNYVVQVPTSGSGTLSVLPNPVGPFGGCQSTNPLGAYPQAVSVDRVDGSVVFVATRQGFLFRSTDSGVTFAHMTDAPAPFLCGGNYSQMQFGFMDPNDRSRVVLFYTASHASSAGLYRSTNATSTTPTFTHLAQPNDGVYASYADAAFDPASSARLWVWETDGLRTSTDFTAASPTFTELAGPSTSGFRGRRMTRFDDRTGCVQGQVGFVDTPPRQFWCTSDAGMTWIRRADPGVLATAITTDPSNSNVMFVASDLGVRRTSDGGLTWIDSSPVPQFPVSSFVWRGRTLVAATIGRGLWSLDTNAVVTVAPSTLGYKVVKRDVNDRPGEWETRAQSITVNAPAGVAWTIAANQAWVNITNTAATAAITGGTGSVQALVSINPLATAFFTATSVSATVTVTPTNAAIPVAQVTLAITIDQTASGSPAIGSFDSPVDGANFLSGTIALTGWALDDVGVDRVEIHRSCVPSDRLSRGLCRAPMPDLPEDYAFVGYPTFVQGARPDVEELFSTTPQASKSGWGYLLLSNGFPNQSTDANVGGQGTFTLLAIAVDREGHRTLLATKSVTFDNTNATLPFGAIDTPDQGGTIPGAAAPYNNADAYPNFGWAVTQAGKCIDTSSTAGYIVAIDGISRTLTPGVNWFAGLNRSDVAAAFPGLCNTNNAVAAYYINKTALGLAPGLHTIAWGITDSGGKFGGVGSRFFSVASSSLMADVERPTVAALAAMPESPRTLGARVGLGDDQSFGRVNDSSVRVASTDRVVIDLGGPVEAGYQTVNGTTRDLPPGSTLDAKAGKFYWQPGVAFLGTFKLAFTTADGGRVPLSVTLVDPSLYAGRGLEMVIDTPVQNAEISGGLRLAGWALDPRAISGSGIDTIHVWAYRRDVDDIAPQFLGVATLGGIRPDVQKIYGAQFDATGYEVPTGTLAPGVYDIVVYAWSARTGGWEDARSVRVVVN